MGILYDWFAAPGDEAAAAVIDRAGGPSEPSPVGGPRRPWRRPTGSVGYPTVRTRIDPVVQGGTLEELLTGRPYDALDSDPRWGRVLASRGADQRLVLTVTDGLVVALADAGADALTAVAGPWSRTEEFWGTADPGHLGAVLDQLAELAREARRCGAGVYCWVCV